MERPIAYPGAIHIHTTYSDGSGSFPQVIAAAQRAGLRWIVVTDHDTLAGKSFAGWHDDLLVIVGHEITPDRNHFLALNVDSVVNREQAPQDYIDEVYGRGGFGIIAHPDERIANAFKAIYRWEDWTIDGPRRREGRVVGIELWNAMSDWAERLTPWNKYALFFAPRLGLGGPTPATLAWWDRLNMAGRRTFGIGGVDAHAFQHRAAWGNVEIFPYRWMFQTLTNYILLDTALAGDAYSATNQVYAALTGGRCYFVNRLEGDGAAVSFMAVRGAEGWQCGASIDLQGGPVTLLGTAADSKYLRLVHNGRVLASGPGMLRQSVAVPGVYRLEGYHGGKPWLYTNPIFIV